jgi:hypothetical protein
MHGQRGPIGFSDLTPIQKVKIVIIIIYLVIRVSDFVAHLKNKEDDKSMALRFVK